MIADRIAEMERPKAQERQAKGQERGRNVRWNGSGPMGPEPSEPYRCSTEIAAEAVGMSRKSYERAKLITDTADNAGVSDEIRTVAREARERQAAQKLLLGGVPGR